MSVEGICATISPDSDCAISTGQAGHETRFCLAPRRLPSLSACMGGYLCNFLGTAVILCGQIFNNSTSMHSTEYTVGYYHIKSPIVTFVNKILITLHVNKR